jgi:hypothetical protein
MALNQSVEIQTFCLQSEYGKKALHEIITQKVFTSFSILGFDFTFFVLGGGYN